MQCDISSVFIDCHFSFFASLTLLSLIVCTAYNNTQTACLSGSGWLRGEWGEVQVNDIYTRKGVEAGWLSGQHFPIQHSLISTGYLDNEASPCTHLFIIEMSTNTMLTRKEKKSPVTKFDSHFSKVTMTSCIIFLFIGLTLQEIFLNRKQI